MTKPIKVAIALLMGSLLMVGCSKGPQQRYQAAVSALEQAREAQAQAADTVAARQQALAEQQQKLAAARTRLEQANDRLQQAEARIEQVVNDQVLFRAIQRELLRAERFSGAAIAVGVADRVVTLTGTVPDKASKQAALQAARSHPGVRSVNDQIEIAPASKPKPQPAT